jgi:hypothetical protein
LKILELCFLLFGAPRSAPLRPSEAGVPVLRAFAIAADGSHRHQRSRSLGGRPSSPSSSRPSVDRPKCKCDRCGLYSKAPSSSALPGRRHCAERCHGSTESPRAPRRAVHAVTSLLLTAWVCRGNEPNPIALRNLRPKVSVPS